VGEEGDIGQAAERGFPGKRFGFVNIEADLEVGGAIAGDTDQGSFVDDGASADIDEGAAGADRAEEFFGHDVVILFCVRGEFDDDVMLREEVFKGGGTGDAIILKDGVRDAGGEGGDRDIERAEEGDHFLCDGSEAVEANASAEEALGDGFHAVLPGPVSVHRDVPVSGAAHGGEDEEEAAFGDGAAYGIAPVGHEEAIFDEFAWNEFFHATGEVGNVTELARFADRKVVGEWRATPRTKKGLGLMFFENRLPGCWISEWEGDRDLADKKGVKLVLDSRR
jgi:hypothetical protein